MSSSRLVVGAVLLGVAGLVGQVHSAPIVPGSVLIPAAAEADPGPGVPVFTTGPVPFAFAGSFSGTLTSTVIAGDATNPLGGLTFTYLLTNDGVSANSIGRLTVTDFTGWATDSSYQTPAVGVAPASIDRNVSGDVVGFNFVPTPVDPLSGFLVPGASSTLLVVQTDASLYAPSTAFLIDGGVTSVVSVGPAPEPATLTGLALAAAGLFARRRRS